MAAEGNRAEAGDHGLDRNIKKHIIGTPRPEDHALVALAVTMATLMDASSLQNLRSLVHDCLAKHMYDAAIFFADKLTTFTNYAPIEVYNLANAFFVAHEYRRCLHLLRTSELIDKDIRFRYLAAR